MTAATPLPQNKPHLRLVHSVEFLPAHIEQSIDWRKVYSGNEIEPDDIADIERQLGQSLKGIDFIVGPTTLGTYGSNIITAVSGSGQNLIFELLGNNDPKVFPNFDRFNSDTVTTLWVSEVDVALFVNTARKNGYAVIFADDDIEY
jgi:hypothetical protein